MFRVYILVNIYDIQYTEASCKFHLEKNVEFGYGKKYFHKLYIYRSTNSTKINC